jgi:uncharacterized membrane protein
VSDRVRTGVTVLALLLATAGAGISAYLAVLNLQGETGVCVAVHGCATVQNSRYGKIAGIPVSVPGVAVYATLILAAIGWRVDFRGRAPELAFVGFLCGLAGVLMSAYLTYVEAFVLDAWCIYCIASAILLVALFAIWSSVLVVTMRE